MRGEQASLVERTRARLLDLWRGEDGFGRALGCVTTTFTFDAELFEEQCLARFLSIQSNPNETAKAYLIEREEKLSQCFACVLVDGAHAAPDRSLRWYMLPVTLPRGGVLHAKLTLLAWEHRVRVLIGSANVTEPAYRRNQEVMAVLDYGALSYPPPNLLIQCASFLNRVRSFAPGFDRPGAGPQTALAAFLASIEQRARSMPPAERENADCALIPLVPGGETVIEQLTAQWAGSRPDLAAVLSPFFDEGQQASDTAAALAGILTSRGERTLSFSAPGRTLPSGIVEIDLPQTLKKSSHPSLQHEFAIVPQRVTIEGRDEDRPLHAKSVWLERDDRALCMIGSSNFTAAGLGLHPRHNIELNIAYLIRDCGSRFGKLCAQSWPEQIPLNDLTNVRFLGGRAQIQPETRMLPCSRRVRIGSLLPRSRAAGGSNLKSAAPRRCISKFCLRKEPLFLPAPTGFAAASKRSSSFLGTRRGRRVRSRSIGKTRSGASRSRRGLSMSRICQLCRRPTSSEAYRLLS